MALAAEFQIIYINGPSSAGKTTLAHAVQEEMEQPFLHIGIDRVIGMMPEKLNNWEGGHALGTPLLDLVGRLPWIAKAIRFKRSKGGLLQKKSVRL